jgi:hypothetical protein
MADVAAAQAGEEGHEVRQRSMRRAATITAVVGIAHAVLFLLSFLLMNEAPHAGATTGEIVSYYSSDSRRRTLLVGLYLMPFAGIAFMWFSVSLRMWIEGSKREISYLLSNIQLVSSIIYVALFFCSAGSLSVVAASVEFSDGQIDADIARGFPDLGRTLLFVFAFRMASMFVLTTSTIGRTTKILPRWFCFSGYAVGLFLLLSASFLAWFAIVFPAWLLVLGVILLIRARQIPADLQIVRSSAQAPFARVVPSQPPG